MKAAPLPRDPKQRDTSWSQGLSPSAFPTRHVDVWRVRLDEPARAGSEASVLSSDEIARADRFHFGKDRIRFRRRRSALRRILGEYLAIPATEVRFEYLTSGKPLLAAEQNPRAVQFNVFHSSKHGPDCSWKCAPTRRRHRRNSRRCRHHCACRAILLASRTCRTSGVAGSSPRIRLLRLLDSQGSVPEGHR
jgi:hypothetical protein